MTTIRKRILEGRQEILAARDKRAKAQAKIVIRGLERTIKRLQTKLATQEFAINRLHVYTKSQINKAGFGDGVGFLAQDHVLDIVASAARLGPVGMQQRMKVLAHALRAIADEITQYEDLLTGSLREVFSPTPTRATSPTSTSTTHHKKSPYPKQKLRNTWLAEQIVGPAEGAAERKHSKPLTSRPRTKSARHNHDI